MLFVIFFLLFAFFAEIFLQNWWIKVMHKEKIEQVTKLYGPAWHEKTKLGTPTMGGVVFAAVALLCVPVAVLGETLQTFVPHLSPAAVVADITSVKEQPMTLMQRYWQGPVVGTHPLFGPGAHNDEPQPVAVVPGTAAGDAHVRRVVAFFESIGCHPFMTTAAEHDKAVARIQNLNFITSLVYFALLADDESLLPFLTPSFRRRHAGAVVPHARPLL